MFFYNYLYPKRTTVIGISPSTAEIRSFTIALLDAILSKA